MRATAATDRAVRRLRPRSLIAQFAVLAVAEVGLFMNYHSHDASFHWTTHFLVGLTAASLFNLGWLLVTDAPAPGQIASVLAAHLIAMFPDFLFGAQIPHHPWMDVFLLHITAHDIPGSDRGWLIVGLVALGIYAIALSRWIATRA